mgnify:CR=1 FL=1
MEDRKNRVIDLETVNDLNSLDNAITELSIKKAALLDNFLTSKDPNDIIKASNYISNIQEKDKRIPKTYIYSPEHEFYNGLGYKASPRSITYNILRAMSRIPIISTIIITRINQIQNFCNFTTDIQRPGWTIRKKKGRFDDDKTVKLTDDDKREIDRIATFLEEGGVGSKWNTDRDDFDIFVKKFTRDSLELDQACCEHQRSRNGELVGFFSTDSATIRMLETIDPRNRYENTYKEVNGYLPIYAQVYNNRILEDISTGEQIVFYPWEMSFCIRNQTSDMRNNGYGISELEILVEVITWLLYGMQYNGNFFKQGSNPKGFFTIKGNANQAVLNDFRQAWRSMVAGVMNSHKIPIFEGQEINWVDMQHSNKDMEFQQWNEFLMLLTCSVYRIDPSELGFRFKQQGEIFGQDGQKERLEHSREKGLKPLLVILQKEINKYKVSELNPKFEFVWTGIDLDDEGQILDNDVKKLQSGLMSLEDGFEKYSGRKLNKDKDTILNPVYLQYKQMNIYGGEQANMEVDEETGDENFGNPFAENPEENPFVKGLMTYVDKNLK